MHHHIMYYHNQDGLAIGKKEDIPAVIELFKMRYEFLKPKTNLVTAAD
jgi:hypothetical protein